MKCLIVWCPFADGCLYYRQWYRLSCHVAAMAPVCLLHVPALTHLLSEHRVTATMTHLLSEHSDNSPDTSTVRTQSDSNHDTSTVRTQSDSSRPWHIYCQNTEWWQPWHIYCQNTEWQQPVCFMTQLGSAHSLSADRMSSCGTPGQLYSLQTNLGRGAYHVMVAAYDY